MRCTALVLVSLVACSDVGDGSSPEPVGPYDRVVDAADVSLLYPLTATTDRDALLAGSDVGAHGVLFPVDDLPPLFPLDGSVHDGADDLRVISIRLDPCSARGGCSPEVRVVFQPVVVNASTGETVAGDGAAHVFYAVPAGELQVFLTEILALKKAHGAGVDYGDTLGPQPILVATGIDGAFATGLRERLLAHVGRDRIQRVTVMHHSFPDQDLWSFTSHERFAGAFVAGTIANVDTTSQNVFGTGAHDPVLGGIGETADSTPTLPALGKLASAGRPEAPTPELATGFAQAIEAQHPDRHSSEDTDCGSCHLAEGARRAGSELYGFTPADEYTSTRSLAYRRDGKAVTNLHAFGYLGTSVSVMQRTANESAAVADRMQAALAPE